MKYSKLPVVLLSSLSSFKQDSTNGVIARYILENANKDLSIAQISKDTHVGIASVSRFVRDLGLSNFQELRELLLKEEPSFESLDTNEPEKDIIKYHNEAMTTSYKSIDLKEIQNLVKNIKETNEIAVFGLGKAECAAICLQTDLFSFNKSTYSTINFKEQIDYIKKADLDTLIILFSATSSYFEYFDIRTLQSKLSNMNIWYIGSGCKPDYIKHQITYTCSNQPLAHPTQLMYIAELIAQIYSKEELCNSNK